MFITNFHFSTDTFIQHRMAPQERHIWSQFTSKFQALPLADAFVTENRVKIKHHSVSQEWHRPYVGAFLETDGTKLATLIAEAERAIVGRSSELLVSSVETDGVAHEDRKRTDGNKTDDCDLGRRRGDTRSPSCCCIKPQHRQRFICRSRNRSGY
jgi:hypothetical protein